MIYIEMYTMLTFSTVHVQGITGIQIFLLLKLRLCALDFERLSACHI